MASNTSSSPPLWDRNLKILYTSQLHPHHWKRPLWSVVLEQQEARLFSQLSENMEEELKPCVHMMGVTSILNNIAWRAETMQPMRKSIEQGWEPAKRFLLFPFNYTHQGVYKDVPRLTEDESKAHRELVKKTSTVPLVETTQPINSTPAPANSPTSRKRPRFEGWEAPLEAELENAKAMELIDRLREDLTKAKQQLSDVEADCTKLKDELDVKTEQHQCVVGQLDSFKTWIGGIRATYKSATAMDLDTPDPKNITEQYLKDLVVDIKATTEQEAKKTIQRHIEAIIPGLF